MNGRRTLSRSCCHVLGRRSTVIAPRLYLGQPKAMSTFPDDEDTAAATAASMKRVVARLHKERVELMLIIGRLEKDNAEFKVELARIAWDHIQILENRTDLKTMAQAVKRDQAELRKERKEMRKDLEELGKHRDQMKKDQEQVWAAVARITKANESVAEEHHMLRENLGVTLGNMGPPFPIQLARLFLGAACDWPEARDAADSHVYDTYWKAVQSLERQLTKSPVGLAAPPPSTDERISLPFLDRIGVAPSELLVHLQHLEPMIDLYMDASDGTIPAFDDVDRLLRLSRAMYWLHTDRTELDLGGLKLAGVCAEAPAWTADVTEHKRLVAELEKLGVD